MKTTLLLLFLLQTMPSPRVKKIFVQSYTETSTDALPASSIAPVGSITPTTVQLGALMRKRLVKKCHAVTVVANPGDADYIVDYDSTVVFIMDKTKSMVFRSKAANTYGAADMACRFLTSLP